MQLLFPEEFGPQKMVSGRMGNSCRSRIPLKFSMMRRLMGNFFLLQMLSNDWEFVRPNVRAKRATAAGRQARAGENVPRTARPGLVACRWRSA